MRTWRSVGMAAWIVAAATALAGPAAWAQDAAKPDASDPPKPARDLGRFDKMDPEIRTAAEIDFSTVDLSKVDTRTRVLAGMALSDLLNVARNKADHRLSLISDYLKDQKLEEAFAAAQIPARKDEPMTLADGQKLAVAYVNTEAGAVDYAGKITTDDPDMLGRMQTAYDTMNRRMWQETVDLRFAVDRAARFLDQQGKFDAFMAWAEVEAKRQADAEEQQMQMRQIEYAKRMETERAARRQVAEANAQRQHEAKMKRLELAYQYKTAKLEAQRDVVISGNERYQTYGGGWFYSDDYYRNRYRGRYTHGVVGGSSSGGVRGGGGVQRN